MANHCADKVIVGKPRRSPIPDRQATRLRAASARQARPPYSCFARFYEKPFKPTGF
jgi:hypothetical protein